MLEFTDINKSLPNGQNMGGLIQEIYFGFHADVLTIGQTFINVCKF